MKLSHHETQLNRHHETQRNPRNLATATKSNHEIRSALEFDEGDAGGAWIDDEAQVGNGAWIGSEMEDQACQRWVSREMEDWARWVGGMGWQHG